MVETNVFSYPQLLLLTKSPIENTTDPPAAGASKECLSNGGMNLLENELNFFPGWGDCPAGCCPELLQHHLLQSDRQWSDVLPVSDNLLSKKVRGLTDGPRAQR